MRERERAPFSWCRLIFDARTSNNAFETRGNTLYIYVCVRYIGGECSTMQYTICVNRTRSLNNICFYVHGWQCQDSSKYIEEELLRSYFFFALFCLYFCSGSYICASLAASPVVVEKCWNSERTSTLFIRLIDSAWFVRNVYITPTHFLDLTLFH